MTPTVEHVLNSYLSATDSEVAHGMRWYGDAYNDVNLTGSDPWVGAGVFAAYSINTPWDRNREMALDTLVTGTPRTDTLGVSVRYAGRILDGEHPMDIYRKSAPKLSAFTRAIAEPLGDEAIAVIDRHARNLAYGAVIGKSGVGKREFATIAGLYAVAADYAGVHVNQLQAITWVAWRRRLGIRRG